MEKEHILMSRKKVKPVYYSLTEYAKKRHNLKILRNDERTQKYRTLYQLLICFDGFKKHEMLTDKQLDGFLGKIHCSRNDLKEHKKSNAGVFYEPINGAQIVKWVENDSKTGFRAGFYSVSIPGFSAREFISSLKKLKKGKDPRPFLSYPEVSDVPFVLYMDYTAQEVNDAIDLLRKEGIFKVGGVVHGEIRYDIADQHLKNFVKDVWLVYIFDLRLLIERLVCNGIPVDEDKYYLVSLFGNKYASKILADAHHIRESYKKEKNKKRKMIAKKFIQDFQKERKLLVKDILKKHESVIKKYSIATEITQDILSSPIISQKPSHD